MPNSSSPAISALDVRKSFGENLVLDGLDLSVETGSVFALLGPNGAGKTTMVRILATLLQPDHGEIRVAGHDVTREPDAVRAVIGVTGQFSAIDELLTGRENLALMADLHHLAAAEARRRIGDLLERFELDDAADRMAVTYSGGDAPPPRPRDDTDRRAADHLPRRADHRPRSAQPSHRLGHRPQPGRRRHHGVPHHPVPRGGRQAGRPGRDPRPRSPGGRGNRAGAQAADSGRSHRPEFADATTQLAAAGVARIPVRGGDALTLQIPTDGNVATLRRVLRELDEAAVDVDGLAIHTPDLDDVFLTLTGRNGRSGETESPTRSPLMTSSYALRDSMTMLRRNLLHLRRYPGLSLFPIFMPVIFLLLFVYVFGGTLGDGITVGGGRSAYVNFLTPGILLFTVAGAAQITAISVAKDMTEGIIARFKTMRIWRPAVLTGHVLGSLFLTIISLAVVIAVALLIGYHPTAGALRWVAALGVLVLLAIALIWVSVALGLFAKSVETASNLPMFLVLLPFLGSAFVPVASMPAGLRWFAQNQPFTPITTPCATSCRAGTSVERGPRRSCGAWSSPPRLISGRSTSTTAGRPHSARVGGAGTH